MVAFANHTSLERCSPFHGGAIGGHYCHTSLPPRLCDVSRHHFGPLRAAKTAHLGHSDARPRHRLHSTGQDARSTPNKCDYRSRHACAAFVTALFKLRLHGTSPSPRIQRVQVALRVGDHLGHPDAKPKHIAMNRSQDERSEPSKPSTARYRCRCEDRYL